MNLKEGIVDKAKLIKLTLSRSVVNVEYTTQDSRNP